MPIQNNKTSDRSKIFRSITVILLIALLILLSRFFKIPQCADIQSWMSQHPTYGPLAFFAAYVVATIGFIPGTILTLLAGMTFGPIFGTLLTSISSVSGACLAFVISRYLLRRRVEEKLSSKQWFLKLKSSLDKNGFTFIVFVRLVPIFPFNGLNYACGVLPIKFRDYLSGSIIGMLPGTFAYVYLGSTGCQIIDLAVSGKLSLSDLPDNIKTNLFISILLLIVLALLPLGLNKLNNFKK